MNQESGIIKKIFQFENLFYLFLFLLPLETRWIFQSGQLNGEYWEYGTFSLYATDILFLFIWIWVVHKNICFARIRVPLLKLPAGEFGSSRMPWLIIALFEFWVFLSLFWSQDFSLGFYGYFRILEGIGLIYLLSQEFWNAKYIRLALIGSGIVQVIFAIVQFGLQYIPAISWFGVAEHIASESGQFVIEVPWGRILRAYGSFPHPNILGAFLVVAFLLLLPYYYEPLEKIRDRILVFFGSILFLFGLTLTFSKSAWLGFIAGTLVFLFFRDQTQKWKKKEYIFFLFLFLFLLGIIFREPIFVRLRGKEALEVRSRDERVSEYPEAFGLLLWHPLGGVGISQYTLALHDEVDRDRQSYEYQPVHNLYLLLAVELGLVGLFFFILLILYPTRLFQVRRIFLLVPSQYGIISAVLVMGLFDHFFWSLESGRWILFLAVGLLYRTEILQRKKEEYFIEREALKKEKERLLKMKPGVDQKRITE